MFAATSILNFSHDTTEKFGVQKSCSSVAFAINLKSVKRAFDPSIYFYVTLLIG